MYIIQKNNFKKIPHNTIIARRGSLSNQNKSPMEQSDKIFNTDLLADEEHLMSNFVICDDAELFYLDCYLQDIFRQTT